MSSYLLTHGHLVLDDRNEYLDGAILCDGETIKDVYLHSSRLPSFSQDVKVVDLGGAVVFPGFFDTHTHGGWGVDFDHAKAEDIDMIAANFARQGTTGFLASLSYGIGKDELIAQLQLMEGYRDRHAALEGIHVEGPFLSKLFPGVGHSEKCLEPDEDVLRELLNSSTRIRQMTIAMELPGAGKMAKILKDAGIKVMCGHSAAVYEDLGEETDGFTHLFNAMRGLHHRDITLVNCAFMNRWMCELIADGLHVDRNVLKLVVNNIDRDKIMLVSDSSVARGMPDGDYEFINKNCRKEGIVFMTDDGHLAGSTVSINEEMQVLYKLGVKYTDLLCYSSLNACQFYGLDKRHGTLQKGKYADLVIMDDDLNIRKVMLRGEFIDD